MDPARNFRVLEGGRRSVGRCIVCEQALWPNRKQWVLGLWNGKMLCRGCIEDIMETIQEKARTCDA